MSWSVLSRAWPICSEPVTFGGGLTMVKGWASGRSGRKRPFVSQCAYHFASIAAGSKVLSRAVPDVSAVMRRGFASGGCGAQVSRGFAPGVDHARHPLVGPSFFPHDPPHA